MNDLSLINDRQTLFYFFQNGCAACEVGGHFLDEFEKKHPSVTVLRLQAAGPFPEKLGITLKATPTYVFRRGQDAKLKAGAMKTAELERWLKGMGAAL